MTIDMSDIDASWPYSKAKTSVLAAAAEVIREQGPRSATLKNIAGRAGITEPAIFRHFEGVDGLFEGLFSVYERFYTRILEIYETEPLDLAGYFDVLEKTVAFIGTLGDFAYLVMYAEQVFSGYEELTARSRELKRRDQELALRFLDGVRKTGGLRKGVEAETVAFAAMGIIIMTIQVWLDSGFAFALPDVVLPRLRNLEAAVKA